MSYLVPIPCAGMLFPTLDTGSSVCHAPRAAPDAETRRAFMPGDRKVTMICRIFGLLCVAGLFALAAAARPIDIREVQEEFAKRGAGDVKMAFLDGHPVVSAALEGQSFFAILQNCDEVEKLCSSIRMESCRRLPSMSRLDVLELTNDFNAQRFNGTAIAKDDEVVPVICVEQAFAFPNEDDFGLREVFEWGETLEDFRNYFEQVERSRLAASILGKAAR